MNKHWNHIKIQIKNILDDKDMCRVTKINFIIALLEDYEKRYLISKGELKNDTI